MSEATSAVQKLIDENAVGTFADPSPTRRTRAGFGSSRESVCFWEPVANLCPA